MVYFWQKAAAAGGRRNGAIMIKIENYIDYRRILLPDDPPAEKRARKKIDSDVVCT